MNADHPIFKYMIEKRNRTNRSSDIIYNHEYSHVALFSIKKIKKEKISNELNNNFTIGINSTRMRYNNIDIKTHAEIDAMKRLKSKMIRYNIKKKICVDLYIIRHTKTGLLAESSPCMHCTMELSKLKWLKINNLFYSKNKTIECIKFKEWVKKKDHHITKGWTNIK